MLILNGTAVGVDSLSIIQNDGYAQPQLLSAVPQDSHTVRVTFNSPMLYYEAGGGVLDPANYTIFDGSNYLSILRVDTVSDSEFDVSTEEQLNVIYTLIASEVYDQYGTSIDTENNSAAFVGIRPTISTRVDLFMFSGTEAGISGTDAGNFLDVDDTPPIIIDEDPVPGERFVPINHNLVYFSVIDVYSEVNISTLDAYIDGYWAFKNGSFQYPFTGPDSYFDTIAPFDSYQGYGFIFDYENLWEADKQIDIRVIAEDLFGNATDQSWYFETPERIPPILINQNPIADATRIPTTQGTIEFDLISTRTTVVSNSIDAYVNSNLAFDHGSFQAPFDGTDAYFGHIFTAEGYDGYKIKLDYTNTPWLSYKLINVNVKAEDAYGFNTDTTYSFRIEDLEPLIFLNELPEAGSSFVNKDATIRIDFYNTGSGVDVHSIDAYVNNALVYDGYNFTSGWDGPASGLVSRTFDSYDGYRLTIDKTSSFESGERVSVLISALNREGN